MSATEVPISAAAIAAAISTSEPTIAVADDGIGDRGEDQRQDEAEQQRRAGPALDHDPDRDASRSPSRLQARKNGSRQREAASRRRGSTNMPQLATAQAMQTEIRKVRCCAAGRQREVGDDRDRGGRSPARRRSRRRAREGRSLRGPSAAAASSPGCSAARRANEGGGSFAARRRTSVARRTALAAPCWTCAPSTPPGSPQTVASRWSSRFVVDRLLDLRRRRRRRRRLGDGGRRRARARRAAVVLGLRRPLAPARRRARAASRSPGAATAPACGRWRRSRARSSRLVVTAALGFPTWLAFLACLLGAAAHTAALWWAETRYERAILLDLTVLELRFRRITDARISSDGV